jgi:epsilon-lactone hydrolase
LDLATRNAKRLKVIVHLVACVLADLVKMEPVSKKTGSIEEIYSDDYTWGQWIFQGILRKVYPRFDVKRAKALIAAEASIPPPVPPASLRTKYKVSLFDNPVARTNVIAPLTEEQEIKVVVIDFHGGAYVGNIWKEHFNAAADIITGVGPCAFYFMDYPLVPTVAHEELFEKVEKLYREVTERVAVNKKVVIMGDSAGGGIAFILAQRIAALSASGDNIRVPDSIVLCSPWLDVSVADPECEQLASVDPFLAVSGLQHCGELLAGGPSPVDVKDPKVSPLFGSLSNLPPVSVWTSTHDMLSPDSRRLLDRFKSEKIQSPFRYFEKKGLLHCYYMFGGDTVKEIADSICVDCGIVTK